VPVRYPVGIFKTAGCAYCKVGDEIAERAEIVCNPLSQSR
jgi:hypothetical protein